jgi:hypothetical protein
MQKSRPSGPTREGSQTRRNGRLGLWLRIIISVWIVWHITGVFLAALSIGPTSPLVRDIAQEPPMQWYLDALYLNQGHSFFAPEVGPGHLIRYELFDERGQVVDKGEFPGPEDYWPRLRNHRHMMLADQADLPGDKQISDYWQRRYLETYGRHLLRVNDDAASVRLQRIAHWPLPRILAVERQPPGAAAPLPPKTLTDPEGYEPLMEVTQRRSDLGPDQTQNQMWRGDNAASRWMGAPR